MISPHFPPDSAAASHRVRLLAPYLAANGWEPTVLTVDPCDYEGGVEPALESLVPPTLTVKRCRAWRANWTRRVGFGDLGLRAWSGLRSISHRILAEHRFDALFITVYPVYPALLGPGLKRRFGVKFVLDYQDPWVGSWGATVGGGKNGAPDLRSRLTRRLGEHLEPIAVRAADAITAVSERTYDEVAARLPDARRVVHATLPLGWDRTDMTRLPGTVDHLPFDRDNGSVNLVYVGTVLPNGIETLRALLNALALVRTTDRDAYSRLRLWFVGTSNQFKPDSPMRVMPMAEQIGVADAVNEIAPRIPYAAALATLAQAHAVMLLGSTEPHYTASKLFPALIADRPILAAFQEASSVVEMLEKLAAPQAVRVVTYNASGPATAVDCLARHLAALARLPFRPAGYQLGAVEDVSAPALAARLGGVFDRICA
ncbi:MAG TPA: glycosyltransferase [Vicinamibacterales bacterium]|nr:glycosyltransferase [Vicinamibacterales bacterium]